MTEYYVEYFGGADPLARIQQKIRDYATKKPDGTLRMSLTVEGGKIERMELAYEKKRAEFADDQRRRA